MNLYIRTPHTLIYIYTYEWYKCNRFWWKHNFKSSSSSLNLMASGKSPIRLKICWSSLEESLDTVIYVYDSREVVNKSSKKIQRALPSGRKNRMRMRSNATVADALDSAQLVQLQSSVFGIFGGSCSRAVTYNFIYRYLHMSNTCETWVLRRGWWLRCLVAWNNWRVLLCVDFIQ